MAVDLYPHQLKAKGEMHNGCVLEGGVGSGKTRVALTYFVIEEAHGSLRINGEGDDSEFKTPKDLYVLTTAKKRDELEWEGEAARFSISTSRDSSLGGVLLTVDSWNNISKYSNIEGAFFIFDEQRLVGSGAWVKAFLKIAKNNHWIMLSATPGDSWIEYAPVFIANGFYKNRTEFIDKHVIYARFSRYPKIDRYIASGLLAKHRSEVLVRMPYERHTTRHIQDVVVDHNKSLFERVVKERWNIYEERPIRDISELFRVMRKLVNSDPSRSNFLVTLLQTHPCLIVFYNFNYELEILRTLSSQLSIAVAEWNGQKHQPIPEGKSWIYLVQYTAGAEGWNCVTTNSMVFFSLNYSYKINEQAKGRIDRLNTPYFDLHYFILRSDSVIDNAIRKTLSTKKSFNEKRYGKVFEHGPAVADREFNYSVPGVQVSD